MIAIPLVGCVITNSAGEVLALHRSMPELIEWELPGGKLKKDETFIMAARRLAHELLGVEVQVVHELGSVTYEQGVNSWILHWFQVQVVSGTPQLVRPKEFDQLAYIDLKHANTSDFAAHLQSLAAGVQNGSIVL